MFNSDGPATRYCRLFLFFRGLRSLFVVGFILVSLGADAQSGWVRAKGKYYAQVSFAGFASDKYYNLNGVELTTSEFTQKSILAYAEYGLGKHFSVEVNYVAYRWNGYETTETVSGGGDAFVGIKYGILKGSFPLSISVGPEIPIGKSDLYAQNTQSSFDDFINLPTGDGEWNVWSRLALSHSLPKLHSYFTVFGAFNYRTQYKDDAFSNQYTAGVEVGVQPVKKLWIQGRAGVYQSLGDPNPGVDFTRGEGTSFTSFGVSASYRVWKCFLVTAGSAFFSDLIVPRQNLYSAPAYTIGIGVDVK